MAVDEGATTAQITINCERDDDLELAFSGYAGAYYYHVHCAHDMYDMCDVNIHTKWLKGCKLLSLRYTDNESIHPNAE